MIQDTYDSEYLAYDDYIIGLIRKISAANDN